MKFGKQMPMQEALDEAYRTLRDGHEGSRYIWDLNAAKRWGNQPASEAQLRSIQRRCKNFDTTGLTKGQASQILNRLFNGGKSA